jgi:chemotaxis protein CheX
MNSCKGTRTVRAGRQCWTPVLELAVQEVFELMLAAPVEAVSGPFAEEGLNVTSVVGLAGQLCGVLMVRCSQQSAARMAGRMLGVDVEQAWPELWDAIGEISNMIAGNFKNKIAGLGDGCMLSVPTVISGGNYTLHLPINEEIRALILLEGEPIVVVVQIQN